MRTLPLTADEEHEWSVIDHGDSLEEILKEIDHLLQSRGLEVVLFNDGSEQDSICFAIGERKE